MAEITDNAKNTLSVIATTSNRIKDLVIKDGQLIFIHDVGRIALDFKNKRTFYNQIVELESELERVNIQSPVNGQYYFVIETGILWTYHNGWIQITNTTGNTLFIGDELPGLGVAKTLYVNKISKEISVWDGTGNNYVVVADKTNVQSIGDNEIELLFV